MSESVMGYSVPEAGDLDRFSGVSADIQTKARCMDMIEDLVRDEGASVEIPCPNPGDGPNQAIRVSDD